MKFLRIVIFVFSICFLFSSCGSKSNGSDSTASDITKKSIEVNFDQNVSVQDLYALDEVVNKKIADDVECTTYFDDYWHDWVEFENGVYQKIDYQNTITRTNNKLESIKDSKDVTEVIPETRNAYKTTKKLFKGLAGSIWDGVSLLSLEDKRTELYNSFSEDKQVCALAVEGMLNSLIYTCYYQPLNEEMQEAKAGANFRCIGEQLEDDEKAGPYMKGIIDDFCRFQESHREFKSLLFMNKLTRDSADYSSLVELGQNIIEAKGDLEFDVEPSYVNRYFENLSDLLKKMQYKESDFNPPIEDWNEAKSANFKAILEDIEIKMGNMVNSLDDTLEHSDWDPWVAKKKKKK
jgi:hypothetical protein